MKILSALQMREADSYTIMNKPIASVELMEIAGGQCFSWIVKNTDISKKHVIVCGTGNNGGDGLVIARRLAEMKIPVEVIILDVAPHSADFDKNLEVIEKSRIPVIALKEGEKLPHFENGVIVDAIFGTGLSRPAGGWIGDCIHAINESKNEVIAIDLPSGLFADKHTEGKVIRANHTLTFQTPKLAFFFGCNEKYTREFHVLDIGLDDSFIDSVDCKNIFVQREEIRNVLKPRAKFSHKGNYGHSLLISGSKGRMGAALLAARACLRSGTGLLTVHAPGCGYEIIQTALPEAMVETDVDNEVISSIDDVSKYDGIGVGPGIGTSESTRLMFGRLLDKIKTPFVADADAINILATQKVLLKRLPANSIITPHPGEFERLAGKSSDDFARHELQLKFSRENNVIVVLKGAYTCITLPDGRSFFNSTGNPGMAKGGSGDALTGIILALLSQKYTPEHAAVLGVYVHGLAGDLAMKRKGTYSMLTTDIIERLPKAFMLLSKQD